MSERNDGGPAFPGEVDNVLFHPEGWVEPQTIAVRQSGMSLRDYLAAKAMQGLCASGRHSLMDFNPEWEGYKGGIPEEFEEAVRESYLLADAMLSEREK